MNQKSWIIGLVILVLILVGGVVYFSVGKKPEPSPTVTQQTTNSQNQPANTPSTISTTNWKTYTHKNFGFEIKLPNNWAFGAVSKGDIGGGNTFSGIPSNWTVEPAPVFEVRSADLPTLMWVIKDEKGIVQLWLNIEYKTKQGDIPVETFAKGYPTPKDKIFNMVLQTLPAGVVKQTFDISDPEFRSGPWYYVSSDKYFLVFISRYGTDINLVEKILSTFKFTK